MKYVLGFVAGLAIGVAAALAALYYNPLTATPLRSRPPTSWALSYSFPDRSSILLTHDEQLKLPLVPADAPRLWEGGIRGAILNELRLEGEDGVEAVATRISVPSSRTNLVTNGVLVDDYWLVTAPGRGSVFVYDVNNEWSLLKETVGRVDLLRRPWSGRSVYDPTQGPAGGLGMVRGVSGEFAGRRGTARELLGVERYGERGFEEVTGELLLVLEDAP